MHTFLKELKVLNIGYIKLDTYLFRPQIQFPEIKSQTMVFCGCFLGLSIGPDPYGLEKKIKSIVTLAKILKKKAIG